MPCRFASSGTVATSRSASRAILALNVASNFLRDLVISVLHRLRQSRTLHTLTFGPISGVHFTVRYPDEFVAKIRALAELHDDHEIVAQLKSNGQTSSTGRPFTVSMIRWIRYKHRITGPSLPAGTLNVSQVCERFGVSLWVVHYWIERGIVSALQRKSNAPYAITIDDCVDRRLRKWVATSSHLHPPSPTQTV